MVRGFDSACRVIDAPNREHAEAVVQGLSDEELADLCHESAEMGEETMEGFYLGSVIDAEVARRAELP